MLILAMIVLFALASLVLAMGRNARVEQMAAANRTAALQAAAAESAAEQYALGLLYTERDTIAQLTEQDFLAVPVGQGYFWITRPDYGDRTLPNFGLMDETTKVSLNTGGNSAYDRLRKLPRITDEIAASIVDWRDTDDAPTGPGVESSYYNSLNPPYNAKNANFESIDELRLIKGVTDEIYYGSKGTTLGDVSYGLADCMTAWSRVKNTAADGTARINLRDNSKREELRTLLTSKLDATKAQQILGAFAGPPNQPQTIRNVLVLAQKAQLKLEDLEKFEDYVTSYRPAQGQNGQPAVEPKVTGNRININTAPRDVLQTIVSDDLTTADLDTLLSKRASAVAKNPQSIAWVYDALKSRPEATLQAVGDRITGRGDVYSADITAVSGDGRSFKHVRVVIDVTGTSPRIIDRQDLTHRGFPLDQSILTNLRSGQVPAASRGAF